MNPRSKNERVRATRYLSNPAGTRDDARMEKRRKIQNSACAIRYPTYHREPVESEFSCLANDPRGSCTRSPRSAGQTCGTVDVEDLTWFLENDCNGGRPWSRRECGKIIGDAGSSSSGSKDFSTTSNLRRADPWEVVRNEEGLSEDHREVRDKCRENCFPVAQPVDFPKSINCTRDQCTLFDHTDFVPSWTVGCPWDDGSGDRWRTENGLEHVQDRFVPDSNFLPAERSYRTLNLHPEFHCNLKQELCSEEQWLRCPTTHCPVYDANFDPLVPLSCPDPSSHVFSHYPDQSIGHLTPVQHCQYFEDFLSNEKRKEKSRDAARCRRSRETDIFTDLAAALPIPPDQAIHLDKASVMRLAIAYLKVRSVVDAIPEPLAKPEPTAEMDELFLKALDGFMLVLSNNGDMVYLSDNVSDYLGVSQMDMMGQSVYEYSHPCDHDELRECLSVKLLDGEEKHPCNFFLRLKCTLTSKGRKVNLKSASYKVIHCTGHLMMPRDINLNSEEEKESEDDDIEREPGASLVVVGCPIPHPSNIEVPLGRHTFLSKHSLNMKFTYADDKLAEYLGWDSNELVGRSVFEFHHALDNLALDKSFKSLFSKGQCETVAYRFLGKKGGYAWVVTQATLIHCSKQHKPLSVVCVNYILSGIECEDEVYSVRQLEARGSVKLEQEAANVQSTAVSSPPQIAQVPVVVQERVRPLAVTASLFRSQEKPEKEVLTSKKLLDSQKDAFCARPVAITKKIFGPKSPAVQKENAEARLDDRNCRHRATSKQPERLFQGKPLLEYNPEQHRGPRPQAVTRSLFAPAPPQEQPSRPPPQTTTASIFAPRTKDMSKGFLTFSEDQPGLTMLKDEPEDLTHLAPTPGDVCVPLEDTPFLTDMLDEFILGNENYCPLLSPDLPSELRGPELGESLKETDLGDTMRNRELGESLADGDPFMYRDTPSPCTASPNLLSPALSKSPEQSVDSLCSPSGSGGGLSEDEMLMLSISDVLADDELALRAPYIPMSDQDEALQLLISDDMVMWGPSQPPDKKSKWIGKEQESNDTTSSLAQLLRKDSSDPKRCNDHGGGLVDPADVLGQVYRKSTPEDSWSVKVERSCGDRAHKRVHAPSIDFENENKRIKCEDANRKTVCLSVGALSDDGPATVPITQQSSQLLQQLMSQQPPKSGPGDGGGGGGGGGGGSTMTASPTTSRQQSSSVLMNLLVSGCDDIVDPYNAASLLQQKLSPLSVNLDNQTVPQCLTNVSLNHLSPDTRKQLINSLPINKSIDSPIASTMMTFDNFEFDIDSINPGLLHGSDLLRALDQNLV